MLLARKVLWVGQLLQRSAKIIPTSRPRTNSQHDLANLGTASTNFWQSVVLWYDSACSCLVCLVMVRSCAKTSVGSNLHSYFCARAFLLHNRMATDSGFHTTIPSSHPTM